jgi:hypothetical protein
MENICKLALNRAVDNSKTIHRYAPIPREELFDEILEPIYRAECVDICVTSCLTDTQSRSFEAIQCYHVMAVLFGVFSLGALFDTDRQPYSSESQEYCYLARVALSCNSQATRLSITGHVSEYLFLDRLQLNSVST